MRSPLLAVILVGAASALAGCSDDGSPSDGAAAATDAALLDSDAGTRDADADAGWPHADAALSDGDAGLLDGDAGLSDADAGLLDADTALSDGDAGLLDADTALSDGDAALSDGDATLSDGDTALSDGNADLPDGNACLGVDCSQPPAPICVGPSSLRTYSGPGQCVAGSCQYTATDAPCSDCCQGAEINLTGEPIGGGVGYSDILSPADATSVVTSAQELLEALSGAQPGDVIYIDDDAEIDLTGQEKIGIPAGVTLASGRGSASSQGGLIYCDSFPFPLFVTEGDGVRLTGLRARGPNPEIGDHDYQIVKHAGMIVSTHADLEVDNCELWAWGYYAVSLHPGATTAKVHHNYIHHTRRAGLGYGVVLDQSDALIEGNLFDACRHFIAGTGRFGTSYTARYNVVLGHANGHNFDMHGARDFDKHHTKAIWRLDEGQGAVAEDSSIGYYHPLNHCSLVGMDTSSCWVPGKINTGLLFDGLDDHLECGQDASLTSSEGTIYFWVQAADLGQSAEIIKLYQDQADDFLAVSLEPGGLVHVQVRVGGADSLDVTSTAALPDTSFHHVAVTQDGAGARIFIDGVESAVTGSNGAAWSSQLSLAGSHIGGGAPDSYFSGVLDELRIYDRALEPGEVKTHFEGNADIAGSTIRIEHNTFRDVDQSAIVIRGRPADGAWIEHNWFFSDAPDHAVRQVNATGNLYLNDNHFGPDPPLGTVLPVAAGAASPASGPAPLTASFDGQQSHFPGPTRQLVDYRWSFGDGDSERGASATHTFAQAGAYSCRLRVFDEAGVPASVLLPLKATPPTDGTDTLDFWVKDSYSGALSGYYREQALVDGQVVWEQDVASAQGWQHVSVDVTSQVEGKDRVTVALRLQNIQAVSNEELIEIFAYWDDVTLFGGQVKDGDFEARSGWSYAESSSTWGGRYSSQEPHGGDVSFMLYYPYKAACPEGSYAELSQIVPIVPKDLLADWWLDEGQGTGAADRSIYGNDLTLTQLDPTTAWVAGKMSQGVLFDGVQGRLERAQPNPSIASPKGSLLLWVKTSAVGEPQALFDLFNATDTDALALSLTAEGKPRLVVTADGDAVIDIAAASSIADGAFHHLAVTQDGIGAKLYVDGKDAAPTGTNDAAWSAHVVPAAVWLGADATSRFAGVLDEVRLYSRALTAAEVAAEDRKGSVLARWSFDEGQGVIAADSSGDQHDGQLQGFDPASCWVAGKQGQALRFDGVDGYVDVAGAPELASPEGTIELWFETDVLDEDLDLVNAFQDGYQNYLLIRRDSSNRILVRIEEDDQAKVSVASSAKVESPGFHHLAVTQDGFGVRIYIDGAEVGASGTNSSYWTDHLALQGLWIGRGHWSFFSGVLDEVTIYARALRPDEIMEHASLEP